MQYLGIDWGTRRAAWCALTRSGELQEGMISADEDGLARLRRAVERAELESRRVISAMAAPSGQPFEVALAEAVTEVAERYHVELDLDLTSDSRLSAQRREALVRIACEAVTNAARHSGAGRVSRYPERARWAARAIPSPSWCCRCLGWRSCSGCSSCDGNVAPNGLSSR